jgi:hypothetical protein
MRERNIGRIKTVKVTSKYLDTSLNATLSTTNPIWTSLELKPSFQSNEPNTYRLSYGTVNGGSKTLTSVKKRNLMRSYFGFGKEQKNPPPLPIVEHCHLAYT